FEKALDNNFAGVQHDHYETKERGHGREEKRCYDIIIDPTDVPAAAEWKNLRVIGLCYSETVRNGKATNEVRYFIGSRKATAKIYGQALRNHWGIENNLHWQLDVTFHEDQNRVCKRHG